MKWYQVIIKTKTESIEVINGILYDVDVDGIEIIDPNDEIYSDSYKGDWDYFDKEKVEFEYNGAIIKCYFETDDIEDILSIIKEKVDSLKNEGIDCHIDEVSAEVVKDTDWANEWKKYYETFKIGENIVIKPSWEEYNSKKDEIVIEIDPGGAFGSGTHETTSMCVEFIEEYIKENSFVFDIGCGSGILGISAAKLGAKKVIAGDIDSEAVRTTTENVRINNLENIVEVKEGDLMEVVKGKADIVVANIIAEVIAMLSVNIHKFLNKDSVFIASGIINGKLDMVLSALKENGLVVLDTKTVGEWSAIVSKLGEDNE
ncbi:50S ribosomal protein L11 methyltransferase [Helicovermis profundi]|uniref:Ribosomal protein L11 methyltransferase n=1 Tax=Helicovermis profundi TaxID=3065157 RepID=A0AAU9ENI1_9FIRM|nr:50S ribosomal protein L11 methyltransferase [Clostridia bacterium S502]